MLPIQSGIFIMPFHDAAKPLVQSYDEDLELIVRAEQLGFDEFWIGEHHTMKYETIPMPELMIARALGETSRIRMGAAPVCLNQHHPAQVASRLAMLDHLSAGRLNLCFGSGSVTADQEMFGVDPKLGSAMAGEAIEMIVKLWTTDPPYDLQGKYWNIQLKEHCDEETQIGFMHRPYQLPHPSICMPGVSRNSSTMKWCGARGFDPFSHCLIAGNVVADTWKTYEQASQEAGRQPDRANWRVARSIFLADTTKEAVAKVRTNSLGKNYEYIGRLFDKGLGRQIYKRDLEQSNEDCNLDYLMTEQIIAGDVDEVLRRLQAFIEETGPFGTLILMSYDWDDKQSWLHSLDLFANELMPALNRLMGAQLEGAR